MIQHSSLQVLFQVFILALPSDSHQENPFDALTILAKLITSFDSLIQLPYS